ncbi:FABP family protein [Embleya sp. NPDC050154]|uniref:FABP family protein n=1 Tax=Embleya sp. NPDC050154 TaxID=3363988 RepID=UPI00379D5B3A
MIEIPDDLHFDAVPLAFLLGTWEGAGVGDYPTIEAFRFGQQVTFGYIANKPFLTYTSRTWLLDEEGERVRPLATETGFWRSKLDGSVDVTLAHPTGIVEIWLGKVDGPRLEMRTDVVARTEDAKDYTAGHRLYGLVKSELMYAYDMAAMGHPLQAHVSAQLKRVDADLAAE